MMRVRSSVSHVTIVALCLSLLCIAGARAQQAPPGRLFTTTYVNNLGGLFWINTDGSNAVSVTPYSYQGARGPDGTPSASANGKVIAFSSNRGASQGVRHIWAMNGDGTGARQLTFDGVAIPGTPYSDIYPVVSPDGTKIAFVANRNVVQFPAGFPYNGVQVPFNDVYVINSDGTNFHQVTQTQPNFSGSGANGSNVLSVVWGPDSKTLAFKGFRLVNGSYQQGIFFIQDDGSSERLFASLNSTGEHEALDWSPDGRFLVTPYGGEAQGAPAFRILVLDAASGAIVQTLFFGASDVEVSSAGTIRFSPDSRRLVFLRPGFNVATVSICNLDGSNIVAVPGLNVGILTWLWWQQGPAVPTPVKLTLTGNIPPDLLLLKVGQPGVTVTPTLYDAKGNVIVHAVGDWEPSDSRYFQMDFNNTANPISTQFFQPLSLNATNDGIAAAPLKVMVDLPVLQVNVRQVFNNAGKTTARFYLTNPGAGGAMNARITSVTLDEVATTGDDSGGTLPSPAVNIPAGRTTGDYNYLFPISGKPSGTVVLLKIKGTYDWYGTINATIRVRLP